MERKKFLASVGVGLFGAVIIKAIPFANTYLKKKDERQIKIVPNPMAVNRKKIGDKNV